MLYCPHCHALFQEDGEVCPYDGVPLVSPPDERLGTQAGSYLLLKVIGKGGMGTVYKAEHVFIGKSFAVKVLHPRFMEFKDVVDRFIFEARAAAKINHPNIVEITDFGYTNEGLPFFVMEYMEGRELIDLIVEASPIPVYRAVNIVVQAADALAACHEEGIVHQDLKPENLFLVKREGRRKLIHLLNDAQNSFETRYEDHYDMVKVLDFGVAHLAKLRETATIAGTPEYMAPEQARGITGDKRSDIYSLGIILYEILTGELPFADETPDKIFQKVFTQPIPSLCGTFPQLDIPPEMDHLMRRALAKDPEERYQTLESFIRDLKGCFGRTFYSRDIPTLLKQKTELDLDPALASDLNRLFSSRKKKGRASRRKESHSNKRPKAVTTLKKKIRTKEYGEVEPGPPIDPTLARDLSNLFKKKKKK